MVKKSFTALYGDHNILYFNEDSSNIIFSCNGMDILNIIRNLNINLDNTNYDEDDPETIIHVAWHIKFEKLKALKNT